MKPTVERLAEQFTQLIGPDAFAKAEAAIAAAKLATDAAAKAAADKAAAVAAAAKTAAAAAPKPATAPAAGGVAPAAQPGSAIPATPKPTTTPLGTQSPSAASSPATPTAVATGRTPGTATPAPGGGSPAVAARPATPAAATVAPAATPPPTLPVQVTSHAAKGYDFDAVVAPAQVIEAARLLDAAGFALDTITGVDWIAQNEMEVVYDYFHPTDFVRAVVRTRVPRATPELPSISTVFPGANWHERETHDFFGIRFTGHPNLKPFLLPEDANFHPLRKDYQP